MSSALLTLWILEVSKDGRAKVSLLVLVREVVDGDAGVGHVLDLTNVVLVGRVLALARHPHHLAHHVVRFFAFDVLLQMQRHVLGQAGRVLVGLGQPSVDLGTDMYVLGHGNGNTKFTLSSSPCSA